MSFIHFHIHSRSSNVFHVTSSSNGLLQLQRELGPRVESTTRGPSRQSGDRSLAPDNAGDMIGTSYWGIYWPMISMRCSIIITYYYWVLYIILETYIHGYIYMYTSNNQRDHIPKQEGKMEKSCNHQYQVCLAVWRIMLAMQHRVQSKRGKSLQRSLKRLDDHDWGCGSILSCQFWDVSDDRRSGLQKNSSGSRSPVCFWALQLKMAKSKQRMLTRLSWPCFGCVLFHLGVLEGC